MSASEREQADADLGSDFDDASERRVDYRHVACLPAAVETPAGTSRSALVRDLSISGTLLLTRARLDVGDRVTLSLYLSEDGLPTVVSGQVMRQETRTIEMAHPWTKSVAVQFDVALPELGPAAKKLADRQAELLGKKSAGK